MPVGHVTSAYGATLYVESLAFDPGIGSFVVGALRESDFVATGDAALTYDGAAMTLIGRAPEVGASSWNTTVGRWTGQASGPKTLDDTSGSVERGYLASSFSDVDEANPLVGSPVTANRNGGATSSVQINFGTVAVGDMAVLIWALAATGGVTATVTGGTKAAEGAFSDGASSIGIAYAEGAGSNVTITVDNGIFNYGVALGFVLRGNPTGRTLYLKNAAAGSSNHGSLQDGGSAPTTATTTTGWDVTGLGANQFALMDFNSERAAGAFAGTAPSAGPNNTLGDCVRSESAYTGSFAGGTWTLTVPMVADSAAGAGLRIRAKLWRSANQDGSSATQITAGWVDGTDVTDLQTGTPQNSVVSFTGLSAVTMTNEYLFVQILCEVVPA
jgi:hypothetical protein